MANVSGVKAAFQQLTSRGWTLRWGNQRISATRMPGLLVRTGYAPEKVGQVLSELSRALPRLRPPRKGSKTEGVRSVDLETILHLTTQRADPGAWIRSETGFHVGRLEPATLYPFEHLFPADRQALLRRAVLENVRGNDLFFAPETDLIAKKSGRKTERVPLFFPWGLQTQRALANFPRTSDAPEGFAVDFLRGMLRAKHTALMAGEVDLLSKGFPARKVSALYGAIDDLLGREAADLRQVFPINPIQGGAGTSLNMMVNEVLANLAMARLGGRKSDYRNPKTGISVEIPNFQQSTNDIVPTGLLMGLYEGLGRILPALNSVYGVLDRRIPGFLTEPVILLSQTEGQDAVLLHFADVLEDYRASIVRVVFEIEKARARAQELPLSGTAVGGGHNASPGYRERIPAAAAQVMGVGGWTVSKSLLNATRDPANLELIANSLDFSARRLLALANDAWDKTRAKELIHPEAQPGSSIMPGKINPVFIEVAQQEARFVMGEIDKVRRSLESYASRITSHAPLMGHALFAAIDHLIHGIRGLGRFYDGFQVNRAEIQRIRERSAIPILTAIADEFPEIGHDLGDAVAAYLARSQEELNRERITAAFDKVASAQGLDRAAIRRAVDHAFDHPEHLARPHGGA